MAFNPDNFHPLSMILYSYSSTRTIYASFDLEDLNLYNKIKWVCTLEHYNRYEYTGILLLLSSSLEISDNTNFFPELDLFKSEMFFLDERESCFNLILPILF